MDRHSAEKPFRVGIFETVAQADQAVRRLLQAGFPKEQVGVICSSKAVEEHFRDLKHPGPATPYTPEAIVAGGLVGATIGGLALAAGTLATGGLILLGGGAAIIGGGALVGSFAGAMMTRGLEKEVADFYEQAVEQGKILVTVEVHGENSQARLAEAERILAGVGTEPVALVEG